MEQGREMGMASQERYENNQHRIESAVHCSVERSFFQGGLDAR